MVRTGYSSSRTDSGGGVPSTTSNMTTKTCRGGRAVVSDSAVGEETNNNTHHSYNSVSDPGLLDRTAYTNASVALQHIEKVDEMSPPPPAR